MKGKEMIIKLILWIGIALLIFSIISFVVLSQLLHLPELSSRIIPLVQPIQCLGQCGPLAPITITNARVDDEVVEGELPEHMDINTSDTIELVLTVPRDTNPGEGIGHVTPTPTAVNRKILTPNVQNVLYNEFVQICKNDSNECVGTIGLLFGSGYEVFASASLATTSFDTQLLGPEEQSANQQRVQWDWNIYPKSAGIQTINVSIYLHWKPIATNGKEEIVRLIWQSPVTIEVNPPPFIQPGQVTISGVIAGFFGTFLSGFSLTWLYEDQKKRKDEKKTHPEPPDKILRHTSNPLSSPIIPKRSGNINTNRQRR